MPNQGHSAVKCQSQRFETRRCYECQIRGHIARNCPMRLKERLRAESQKMVKNSVGIKEKPKEKKQKKQKVKLSQGQKDRLRKKKKKAREYLEKILSLDTTGNPRKSSDELLSSTKKASKTNSSDANIRTKGYNKDCEKSCTSRVDKFGKLKHCRDWVQIKNGDEFVSEKTKEPSSGDDFDLSKSKEPRFGNDSDSSKLEEPRSGNESDSKKSEEPQIESADESLQSDDSSEKEIVFDKTPSDTGSSDDSSEKSVAFDQSPTDDSSDDEEERHINIGKSHLAPESFHFYFADRMKKLKEKRAAKEQQEMKAESVA
ncbi:suppressor protein SRP40-like [Helianthus annuus]|uniref:suppressor protein SRP40-like n=1 Tax=Helianthus annuus TaxID=4232 RepID=UPI00165336AA|nr:suppressor protein SRP40-like [Helianthus annuus]